MPGARPSSRSRWRRSASSTSCRRSWPPRRAPLRETLDALARFDFWASRARLAAELDGIRAETSRRDIVLLSARHPGLSGRVVPIDVRLGDGYTALVITGPNTGGKTVALRTVGLLCLMHQSGLHVPAAIGSRLPILRDVFADIGDEQSVAQSLSTFSGHLRSIVRIVAAAGPGCLVLLDELGAGTDPTEGSALAQALLDQFIRSGRARGRDDALRGAEDLRPRDTPGAQRVGGVRPRDAQPDLPADHRPAGHQPGIRHRGTPGPVAGAGGRRPVAAEPRPAGLRADARVHQGVPAGHRLRAGDGARRRGTRPRGTPGRGG